MLVAPRNTTIKISTIQNLHGKRLCQNDEPINFIVQLLDANKQSTILRISREFNVFDQRKHNEQ